MKFKEPRTDSGKAITGEVQEVHQLNNGNFLLSVSYAPGLAPPRMFSATHPLWGYFNDFSYLPV